MKHYDLATCCYVISFILALLKKGDALACFKCHSVDGSAADCDDDFGNYDETAHLFSKDCTVSILEFRSFYCVKIKGVNKETGERVLIRTCSVDDWGSTCGEIVFLQGDDDESPRDNIEGCLASCDYDGCNVASKRHDFRWSVLAVVLSIGLLWTHHNVPV